MIIRGKTDSETDSIVSFPNASCNVSFLFLKRLLHSVNEYLQFLCLLVRMIIDARVELRIPTVVTAWNS